MQEEVARAAMASYRDQSEEEILESHAIQSAQPRCFEPTRASRSEVTASRTTTPIPVAEKPSLLQSKIFGSVSKPATEKRKRVEEENGDDYSAKKIRPGGEGVGLGYRF